MTMPLAQAAPFMVPCGPRGPAAHSAVVEVTRGSGTGVNGAAHPDATLHPLTHMGEADDMNATIVIIAIIILILVNRALARCFPRNTVERVLGNLLGLGSVLCLVAAALMIANRPL